MSYTCFEYAIDHAVAHVQLSRPEKLNAMNVAFWDELPALIGSLGARGDVRAIVISAQGKHFTAGMDIAVFQTPGVLFDDSAPDAVTAAAALRMHIKRLQKTFSCLDEVRVPVIVAVQGGVIGGGVDMTTACDIRYCTEDAFFQIQETNLAMTADVGTFPRLCRLIPEGWVRELAYTGRRLLARQAEQLGLVNRVFEDQASMVEAALATAREIASKAPAAVAGCKEMINYARDHSTADTLNYVATWNAGMLSKEQIAAAAMGQMAKQPVTFPDLKALPED